MYSQTLISGHLLSGRLIGVWLYYQKNVPIVFFFKLGLCSRGFVLFHIWGILCLIDNLCQALLQILRFAHIIVLVTREIIINKEILSPICQMARSAFHFQCTLRPRLHEHSFICNRIVLHKVTPSVYTTTMYNRVLLKTLPKKERFQNDTVTSVV